MPPALR